MSVKYVNNGTSLLASGITNSATSLTITTGTGTAFGTIASPDVMYLTITSGSTMEIVKATALSGDTFTIVRAQDGTTAQAFSTGATVSQYVTKAMLDQLKLDAINPTGETNYQVSTSLYPTVKPSLLLDFANTKALDPRITFSRASTGTYYDGSLVMAEQNLLTYSQVIGGTNWVVTNATATTNATVAPDGTTTATALIEGAGSNYWRILQTVYLSSGTVTHSVYASAAARTWFLFQDDQAGKGAYFQLSGAGSIGNFDAGVTASIVQIGSSSWYRCSITLTASTTSKPAYYAASANGTITYSGSSSAAIYLWGAQLEQRSAVTAYNVTTTSPITNYIPVLKTAAANVPRFDTNPTTGESLGLLIEEQRTNLVTYSSDYSNAAWTKGNSAVTTAAGIAPDGTQTAQKFVEDTSSSVHQVKQLASGVTANAAYTATVFMRALDRTRAFVSCEGLATGGGYAYFDLSNGSVVSTGTWGTATLNAYSISSVGNGWYRISVTSTVPTDTSRWLIIDLVNTGTTTVYTGNGYSGILIWGAQIEAGSFATSLIPTLASQVTRSADSASMTGTNFSSWYNAGQGAFSVECKPGSATDRYLFSADDGTSNNRNVVHWVTNTFVGQTVVGNSSQANPVAPTNASVGANAKVIYSYAVASFGIDSNGGTVATASSGTVPVVSELLIGSSISGAANWNSTIKRLSYFPVALTSAQLQAITA